MESVRVLNPKLLHLGDELRISELEDSDITATIVTTGLSKAMEYVEDESKLDKDLRGEDKKELVIRTLRWVVQNFVSDPRIREELFGWLEFVVPHMIDLLVKANNAGIWKKSKWKQLAKKLYCCKCCK